MRHRLVWRAFPRSFLLLLLILLGAGAAGAEDRALLLHWNDFHGQVHPRKRSSGALQGGVRALSRMIEIARATEDADRVLVLDAGDWFQGTPEGNLTGGKMIIDLWNAIGVDAAVVGNHDFDHGEENLEGLIERADFPVLGANVVDDAGSTRSYLLPSTILRAGGITFGVVGLLTPDTPRIVKQEVGQGLRVAPAAETLRRHLPRLREQGAECIVVLSHLGAVEDQALAAEVAGIDLIIGGHSHTLLEEPWKSPKNGTLVAQAGSRGSSLGRIEITRSATGFLIKGGVLPVSGETSGGDSAIDKVIERYRDEVEGVMGEVIGELPQELSQPRLPSPPERSFPRSSPLGSWICAEIARAAGTEIALHNWGGIRDELKAGTITARDLFQVSPFGNGVVVCEMKGSDLEEVIARSVEDPKVRLDVHGLLVKWKDGSDGPVLASIKVGNRSLGRERSYRVATNDYLAYGGDGWTQFGRGQGPRSIGREVYEVTVEGIRGENLADSITAALRASSFEQTGNLRQRWVSLLGLLVLVGLGYLLSIARNRIRLRPLLWGTILQVILALLILQTRPGRLVFDWAKAAFQKILDFSIQGSKFVFGPLADLGISGEIFGVENAFIFAFQVAGTIILVSSLTAILYHLGVMQAIVWVMAKVMQFTMRTSGAESLATAANVFIGQTEAPLVVRPYLAGMTASEIMALMTGGMATVAGGVLAAYVSFGIDAGHLLAASVMSAPAALALAKLMVPETEHSQTAADVPFEMRRTSANILDAACRGASDGLKLAINVMAMLIAFISLVHLVNFLLDGGYQIFHDRLTAGGTQPMKIPDHISLEGILGWILAPIAWLLGIPWREATEVGSLLGVKMVLNEFVAYLQLAGMSEKISPRSFGIATYALCGFANFSSIAIQIGGISALEQGIRPQLARHGLRAMLGGTLAALMTAAIAGVLL